MSVSQQVSEIRCRERHDLPRVTQRPRTRFSPGLMEGETLITLPAEWKDAFD